MGGAVAYLKNYSLRSDVINLLPSGNNVIVHVKGMAGTTTFEGFKCENFLYKIFALWYKHGVLLNGLV